MRSIVHIITGLEDGGAEAVLYRLCAADAGNQHTVVSLGGMGKYGPLLEERGISVTALKMPRGRVTISGLSLLWKTLRRVQPDAIQTWMYHADLLGGIVARLAGYSNVSWGIRHTTLDPVHSSRSTILVAQLCARLSRLVPRRIICCAEKSRIVHASLGYDVTRMSVIPNGYDLTIFKPDPSAKVEFRASLGLNPVARVIGFVARFDPQKDHRTLLEALALLKQRGISPTCLLVGYGMTDENITLTSRIAELGLGRQVRLLGRCNDVATVMNALDLHVMSSSSEAFPNVLAEAMACGTPCISTDVGDAAAIVGDTGWIVPPKDFRALADAIAVALVESGRPAWRERQKAARERVEAQFSVERMVEAYRAVWSSVPSAGTANRD